MPTQFSVETRWDVEPDDAEGCTLTCHVQVPFSKSTLLMPAIKKGALDSTRDAFRDLLVQVQRELAGAAVASEGSSSSSPQPLQASGSLPPSPCGPSAPVSAAAQQGGAGGVGAAVSREGWTPVTKTLQGFLVERNNIVMLAVMFWGLCVLYMQVRWVRGGCAMCISLPHSCSSFAWRPSHRRWWCMRGGWTCRRCSARWPSSGCKWRDCEGGCDFTWWYKLQHSL